MGAGGIIIILKSIRQTLSTAFTATAPFKVWHSILAAFLLGCAVGKWLL